MNYQEEYLEGRGLKDTIVTEGICVSIHVGAVYWEGVGGNSRRWMDTGKFFMFRRTEGLEGG